MIKINHNITLIAIILILLLSGCQNSSSGGITIPQSDSTPPALTLTAGQPGGQNVSVSAGGSKQSLTLISKTGELNLSAAARDPESGVQALEIWLDRIITSCDISGPEELCSTTSPEQFGKLFESIAPQKLPGETTGESSIMFQVLELSTYITQGNVPEGQRRIVELRLHAVAVNHLGGRTKTPFLKAVWTEP